MKKKKDWLNNIDDDSLKILIVNKKYLKKTPQHLDNEAFNLIENYDKIFKEEKKGLFLYFKNASFKFAAAALFLIMLTVGITAPVIYLQSGGINNMTVAELFGNAVLIRKNKKSKIDLKTVLRSNDIIMTSDGSSVRIKSGDASNIGINENSELKIVSLKKRNKRELSVLYLNEGHINCSIAFQDQNSELTVAADAALFDVSGTEFGLTVDKNKDAVLEVDEGEVAVSFNFDIDKKLEKIRKKDSEIYDIIYKVSKTKIRTGKGESVIISKSDADKFGSGLIRLIDEAEKKLDNPQKISNAEKQSIVSGFEDYLDKNQFINKIQSEGTELDLNNPNIRKMPISARVTFNENSTVIGTDGRLIYIACNKNKKIYCVNPETGKMIWSFGDPDINDITAGCGIFGGYIVFATPNHFFALNTDGTLKYKEKINYGPVYFPDMVDVNDVLYIPGLKTLYRYKGGSISVFKDLPDTFGQIYLSKRSDNLIYVDMNEQSVKEMEISGKKIINKSVKLKNRIFMPPYVLKDNLYIADTGGYVYKIDGSLKIIGEIMIDAGITGGVIAVNNGLYFIANNGYFYKVNADDMKTFSKIMKIDNKPDPNKYLTRKLFITGNFIFYPADTGKVFYYNTVTGKNAFIEMNSGYGFTGSAVQIKNSIYFINTNGEILSLELKYAADSP